MTDKRSDRGDGRDAKGRWTKNTSGNPSGRPPNVPDLDMADVYNFSQFPAEIAIGGEKKLMTRQEVVWLKLFESALKGRITAQKYLIEKFEQAQEAPLRQQPIGNGGVHVRGACVPPGHSAGGGRPIRVPAFAVVPQ